MLTITQDDLDQATARAEAAAQARTRAEAELAANPFSEIRAKKFTAAAQEAARLADAARRLAAEHEEQLAAAKTDRQQLEKAAAKQIGTAEKELKASRSRLVEAANAAQKALVELMDATADHDALVRSHESVLTGCGLAIPESSIVPETGTTRTGLRLRGQWWLTVEHSAVAAWMLHRVAAARLPRLHQLPALMAFTPGTVAVQNRADGLLDGVDQPAKVHYPARPRLESAAHVLARSA